uniref:Uncharacterized protein n=1 Tax=Anguilla anguilla TaxID=7936 RepID=A0A0E9XAA8_ANGAN
MTQKNKSSLTSTHTVKITPRDFTSTLNGVKVMSYPNATGYKTNSTKSLPHSDNYVSTTTKAREFGHYQTFGRLVCKPWVGGRRG